MGRLIKKLFRFALYRHQLLSHMFSRLSPSVKFSICKNHTGISLRIVMSLTTFRLSHHATASISRREADGPFHSQILISSGTGPAFIAALVFCQCVYKLFSVEIWYGVTTCCGASQSWCATFKQYGRFSLGTLVIIGILSQFILGQIICWRDSALLWLREQGVLYSDTFGLSSRVLLCDATPSYMMWADV